MLAWQTIPVIIVNRNRLPAMKRLIDWLLAAGCMDIRILDNLSSYPPLLQYYGALPPNVSLRRLPENLGPQAFWKLALNEQTTTPYIVTDSDVVPSEFCPADLIAHLLDIASGYPDHGKVGPGLDLHSISPRYGQGAAAFQWESQFWHRPALRGAFAAPIDTTFALYPPKAVFTRDANNLRLGHPYLFEHTPWQVDESNLDPEEIYYREQTSRSFSHWSAGTVDPRIAASDWIRGYHRRPRILHLGGGNEYIPGWLNADVTGRKLDIRFDLCGTEQLPLPADSIDGFYMCHVFEHVTDTSALMQELYRVGKNGAKIHMRLPHGSNDAAFEDPTHVRAYFENSFVHFAQPACPRGDCAYTADWQVESVVLVVAPAALAQGAEHAYQLTKTLRNVVFEMIVELRAVKPARPRLPNRLTPGKIVMSSDARVAPNFG